MTQSTRNMTVCGIELHVKAGKLDLAVEFLKYLDFQLLPPESKLVRKRFYQAPKVVMTDNIGSFSVVLVELKPKEDGAESTVYFLVDDPVAILREFNAPDFVAKFMPTSNLGTGIKEVSIRLDEIFCCSFVFKGNKKP